MNVLTNLMSSAMTFEKEQAAKLLFIILNIIDLNLTLFAISEGATELNPLMQNLFNAPYRLYLVKLILPTFLAWLVPGKLLVPAVILLAFVIGWDIRELILLSY